MTDTVRALRYLYDVVDTLAHHAVRDLEGEARFELSDQLAAAKRAIDALGAEPDPPLPPLKLTGREADDLALVAALKAAGWVDHGDFYLRQQGVRLSRLEVYFERPVTAERLVFQQWEGIESRVNRFATWSAGEMHERLAADSLVEARTIPS